MHAWSINCSYIYIGKCNDVNWYSKGERITILKPSFLTWFPANMWHALLHEHERERERTLLL